MNAKSVIFVAGTSRSGSTMLNLILAQDPHGMALGEIHATIRPVKKHHFTAKMELKSNSDQWSTIISRGPEELYSNIFKEFPNLDFMVDSSKHAFWIRKQNQNCANQQLNAKNVLIYKSPHELANSFIKRKKNWIGPFVGYHRKYFSLVDEFYVVSYKDIVSNPSTLEGLCSYLDIPYSEKKFEYWEGSGNRFFGSKTPARKSEIRYDAPNRPGLDDVVSSAMEANPQIQEVLNVLESCKNGIVRAGSKPQKQLALSGSVIRLHSLKYALDGWMKHVFPKKLISIDNDLSTE